jgi:uroporphyrin-3 C-methyltransferase/uroporphyrinogen III methyltransferase/synthase
MALRLQKGDASNAETGNLVRSVQESTKELQAKVALLESKQQEAQSQQLALEQLYQDLSKNRDEWALTEIEQVLSTASQQLQLAGNVPGALIALQNADRSLSRSDKPQFITIRRAIARDTDKLKALPKRGFGRRRPAPRQRHRADRHAADAVRRKADPAGAAGKAPGQGVRQGWQAGASATSPWLQALQAAGTAGAARCGPTCAS